jgi:hypothetical protein
VRGDTTKETTFLTSDVLDHVLPIASGEAGRGVEGVGLIVPQEPCQVAYGEAVRDYERATTYECPLPE